MRSFSPNSLREVLLKVNLVFENLNNDELINYIVEEFSYRIYLFIGEHSEYLDDCIHVSLFSQEVHNLELKNLNLKDNFFYMGVDKWLSLTDFEKLYFEVVDTNLRSITLKLIKMQDINNKNLSEKAVKIIQEAIRIDLLKLAYSKIKYELAAANLEIIRKKKLGLVMSNLQPDDRGEFLLITNDLSNFNLSCRSFEIDKHMNISNISHLKPFNLKFYDFQ